MTENLRDIVLTEEDIIKIQDGIKQMQTAKMNGGRDKNSFITDLYKMRYKTKMSTSEMAQYFNISLRMVQARLKELNWTRTRFEAQQIAAPNRDYKDIKLKSQRTILKNSINGSGTEEYIRNFFNLQLSLTLPDVESIVGLNNKTILDNGKEIDIPIIIFYNKKIFKFGIEVSGYYWHKDSQIEKDLEKKKLAHSKRYEIIEFKIINTITKPQIEDRIASICDYIRNVVLNDFYEAYI